MQTDSRIQNLDHSRWLLSEMIPVITTTKTTTVTTTNTITNTTTTTMAQKPIEADEYSLISNRRMSKRTNDIRHEQNQIVRFQENRRKSGVTPVWKLFLSRWKWGDKQQQMKKKKTRRNIIQSETLVWHAFYCSLEHTKFILFYSSVGVYLFSNTGR